MRGLLISILVFAAQSLAFANEPPAAIATTNKMTITGGDGNTVTLTGTGGLPPVQSGWIDWDADTNTTALTLGGDWFYLLSTSVNQQVGRDGNVTGANLWIHNATNLSGIGFVVCRPTGTANQYTVIGKSDEITTGYATGANTFYFTSPIENVLSTDIFAVCVEQSVEAQCFDARNTASEFDCNDVGTGVLKWLAAGESEYNNIDVNDNFTTTSGGTTWFIMPMCPLMEPPTVISIGDSIATGSTLNFSYRENYSAKDRIGSYQQVLYRAYNWSYENGVGTSSARSANAAADLNQNAKEQLGIFDKRPQYIHCHVGINDIADVVTWDAYIANITTILRHCEQHNAKLILDALFPITGKADNTTGTWAHNTTRDTWNLALAAWAATEPNIIFLNINDTLGQERTVNKTGDTNTLPADNLWDLIPGYINTVDGLGVHLSQTGCSAASCAMNYALGYYFGVDVGAAYSEAIYINHNDVNGMLVNFPVVIDANCIKNNNFWAQVGTSGGDIWVDYAGSEIPRELVAIDTTAHTIELWFILPSVSSSIDTKVTLHWGGDICRGNSTNVWDPNTKMVLHMGQSALGTAPQLKDSTIYINDFNASSGWATASYTGIAGGKIGIATDYNACGNFTGKTANLNNATITGATISFWGDFNTLTSGTIISKGSVSTITKIMLDNTYTIYGGIGGNGSTYKTFTTIPDYRNVWHKFDMRWANSTDELSFYVDGALIGTATETSNWPTNSTFSLGAATVLKGVIDEVRISDVDRGADWIYTTYQNQNDPEGFWSGGSNIEDLDIFCEQWLQDVDCFGQPGCPDLIHDDYVDFADYAELVRDWGI